MAQRDGVNIDKVLQRFVARRQGAVVDRTNCPDEEALADYIAEGLPESQRREVQQHLSTCAACIDELVSFREGVRGEIQEEVPESLIAKAKGLVSEVTRGPRFFDISVRLTETAIELINTTAGRVHHIGAEPVAVRGKANKEGSGFEIETEMGEYNVRVRVEQGEPGACDVVVGVRDPIGDPVEGMRVGLFSNERERASYLTRKGRVAFDGITQGKYSVPIRDESRLVGTVRLDIA